MSSMSSDMADVEKTTKPSDATSIKAGEVFNSNSEYERYLALHAKFKAANGHQHRKLLRKRKRQQLVPRYWVSG